MTLMVQILDVGGIFVLDEGLFESFFNQVL